MAVGKSFLDQYSVFCVFGSVVGCVVVPLITQSVESLIFSAIVISLTANRFSKKVVIEPSIKNENKEQTKVKGSKDIIQTCKRKKKPPSNSSGSSNTNNSSNSNSPGNQNALYHQLSPSELRKQHREEAERREYEKLRELEKREEEKREKKLKKREERQKRKINEKKESEKLQVAKEKQIIEKVSTVTRSPKDDNGRTTTYSRDRTFSSSTFHQSNPVLSVPTPIPGSQQQQQQQQTAQRKSKYEHYRPNIPRFARMAKQRQQMGFNMPAAQQTPPQSLCNGNSLSQGNILSQPISWQQRSSPSPDNNSNCVIIAPNKVQGAIGCRKSPEPTSPPVSTPVIETMEIKEQSGCYTLFGESEETKKMVSIIRMEAGLEKIHT